MGCGACHHHQIYAVDAVRDHLHRLLSEVRPRTLLPASLVATAVKLFQQQNGTSITLDPAQPTFPLSKEQLLKWKVLIITRNHDFCKEPLSSDVEKKHSCVSQILLDIKRTFPGKLSNEQCQLLTGVLTKLAAYFPQVGYTQGMNYLVGFLLLCGYEDQTEVFWMAVSLLVGRRFLMLGMFEDGFPLVQLYMCIFKQKLEQLEPALADHLQKAAIPLEAWLFQWLLTWFLYSLAQQQALLLWNFILQRNGLSSVVIALSIVMELSSQLMQIEPGYKVMDVLRGDRLKRLDIRRILERAEQLNPDVPVLNTDSLSDWSKYYHKLLTSKDHTVYKHYLQAIEKARSDHYAPTL